MKNPYEFHCDQCGRELHVQDVYAAAYVKEGHRFWSVLISSMISYARNPNVTMHVCSEACLDLMTDDVSERT